MRHPHLHGGGGIPTRGLRPTCGVTTAPSRYAAWSLRLQRRGAGGKHRASPQPPGRPERAAPPGRHRARCAHARSARGRPAGEHPGIASTWTTFCATSPSQTETAERARGARQPEEAVQAPFTSIGRAGALSRTLPCLQGHSCVFLDTLPKPFRPGRMEQAGPTGCHYMHLTSPPGTAPARRLVLWIS